MIFPNQAAARSHRMKAAMSDYTISHQSPFLVIRSQADGRTTDREKRKLQEQGFSEEQIAVLSVVEEIRELIREAEQRRAARRLSV